MANSHSSLFDGLNPQQRQAVEIVNGRLLILAGAGSGKTRVLTLRMCYLIKNLNVSPKSILGLTFTNKAAAEMHHRMSSLIEKNAAKQVTLCTFHSFCMQILRAEIQHLGYTTQFSLYTEKDVKRLIQLIARDILESEGELPSLTPTIEAITYARNRGLEANEITATGSDWHDQFSQTVYQRLQDSMRAYNAVDFDHLLGLTVELFEKHPDILSRYQERFQYIMIDEYQDTNPVQYRLASLLSASHRNLCVVGDDDQSIYGWRGAEVRNILEFADAQVIKLEQNYRSTNTILKAANAVISQNKERYVKALWSDKGEGNLIEVFNAPTHIEEAEAVVCRLAKWKETHQLRWKDFAILYRSNALSRPFEMALMKHGWFDGQEWVRGIPYQVFGGVEFYERREVQDLFAYFRTIVNPLDQEAILRVVNLPRRGVGETSLDILTAYNRSHGIPLWDVLKSVQQNTWACESHLPAKAVKGVTDFIEVIEEAKGRFQEGESLAETANWLIERINYKTVIHEEVKSDQMRDFKWENVQDFVTSISDFEKKVREELHKIPTLQDFITTFPLEKDWGASRNPLIDDKVNLLTFHSSKGLEFPVCFLVGMEDHIMPHEKSMKATGIEEERRLMYVAITRAMQKLTISMARERDKMGKKMACRPSRFLFEIPKELMNVTHWHEF